MAAQSMEFSFRSRQLSLSRMKKETYDLLVVGGGILGAATARDAALRGLKVALVEKHDFAYGTSSRSSKLIHGGLRYLEKLELGLVYESLHERTHLLKSVPHMVRPLKFYWPVYEGDDKGIHLLSAGLWLYDVLSLFRSPEFHQKLSREALLESVPFLKSEGLRGGFQYYDASMWDDVLTVETLRSAYAAGAQVVNYVEALEPIWEESHVRGFRVRDLEDQEEFSIRACKVVLCSGPWCDELGSRLGPGWKKRLSPSQGTHLIFDLKRLPLDGAMVMAHPQDGRISFVIPRKDLGAGVVIVGTTDAPAPRQPEKVEVTSQEVQYLIELLNRYFPKAGIKTSDILNAYVGIRPLVGGDSTEALQEVSREHVIEAGPGGVVLVMGGKYTTHRKIAEEVLEFTLKAWKKDSKDIRFQAFPTGLIASQADRPVNEKATAEGMEEAKDQAKRRGWVIPEKLWDRYGGEALDVYEIQKETEALPTWKSSSQQDPEGFPYLEAQLRHALRCSSVLHLEDFILRRVPLFLTREDGGRPWWESLAKVWKEETGATDEETFQELERLESEIASRTRWKDSKKSEF